MPFRIVRNDITKMNTEAIVNTANARPVVGPGCDQAVYEAAGVEELLSCRKQNIGFVKEGDVFITPGFALPAKYIIHAVSPRYVDGKHGEEELLRSCYRKSLALAAENGIRSIAFPVISTGNFSYPKEEGMRIAVDEIQVFLQTADMQIDLVVFDEKATRMGKALYPDLEEYIDKNYVEKKLYEASQPVYGSGSSAARPGVSSARPGVYASKPDSSAAQQKGKKSKQAGLPHFLESICETGRDLIGKSDNEMSAQVFGNAGFPGDDTILEAEPEEPLFDEDAAIEEMERKLKERMSHMSDTFPQYLLYLIREKGMENAEVYKRAIVDKKVFSKIKNNPEYHPQKLTALCLCIGAKLNLDESKNLLARAGYALSPCDKTDIIFSYFIENKIYDMIELDIQLEEHGLPCVIS